MAKFNEILVGRYNRFFQKFLSMKGPPVVPQLASELMGVWSMFHGTENRFLEGWDTFQNSGGVAAVAAQFGCAQLRNPTGSNVLAVITKAAVSEATADTVNISWSPTQPADLSVITHVPTPDTRQSRTASCVFSSGTLVAGGALANIIMVVNLATSSLVNFLNNQPEEEILLFPGSTFRISAGTANQTINPTIFWRERAIEDSERFG